ncbi:MAG: hypothetical protein RLZZ272_1494 [Actinomycetota bacterium]
MPSRTSTARAKGRSGRSTSSSARTGAGGHERAPRGSRSPDRARPDGITTRVLRTVGGHVVEQRRDVLGVVLLLLAVLSGLGVYADAAGPVGRALTAAALGSVGLVGYAIPALTAALAVVALLEGDRPGASRAVVGVSVGVLAVVGGLHLSLGRPTPSDGLAGLRTAGGLLGWALATPLEWAASAAGAWAIVVALALIGVLITTGFRLSGGIDRLREGAARRAVLRRERAAERAEAREAAAAAAAAQRDADTAEPTGLGESPTLLTDAALEGMVDPTTGELLVGDRAALAAALGLDDDLDHLSPEHVRAAIAGQRATQPPLDAPLLDEDHTVVPAGPPAAPVPIDDERTVPVGRAARRLAALDADAEGALEGSGASHPGAIDGADDATDPGRRRARRVRPPGGPAPAYELPPLDLLVAGKAVAGEGARAIDAQTTALQATFDQFGIDAKVARWSRGPTVTRFEVELGPGVQVRKVANLGDDIAYALAAPDVRIVAPIPGKSAIGIEVPNRQRDLITLGDVLRSEEARRDPHPLTVAIGVDIAGNAALVNLATMPHLLVSGSTGSGKSVTLNGMISSVIARARPDQVRLLLVDPKRVELNHYDGAPHLLAPVVTDPRRAADAVQWCVKEMEQRYELLAHLGFRNIDGYNEAYDAGRLETREGRDGEPIEPTRMPYVLLVIDELADLMLVAPRDVEDAICRIAQMARAVGIHMVIATQRPSVDVITGLIKANIPSRLALAVASQTDSRTILDMGGAEKLVGRGDMLFLPASQGKPSRLQGCWVTEREITSLVEYCRAQREAEYEPAVVREGEDARLADAARGGDDGSDEALLRRAAEQVVSSGLGSTSMLQRKLRVGFARAGRLMDELEQLGVVGPNEGSKAREVLWGDAELAAALAEGLL